MTNDKLVILTSSVIPVSKNGFVPNLQHILFPSNSKYRGTLFRRENKEQSGIPRRPENLSVARMQVVSDGAHEHCIFRLFLVQSSKRRLEFDHQRRFQWKVDKVDGSKLFFARYREVAADRAGTGGGVARGMLIPSARSP
ncbi:hypothetical protein K0M31_019830 [Melipona bicolor]|uniref:Uncharacterized protein n=1 Tax=Melipona bicolor TaxID=60889 RepID=A0AA40G333_9HYME|nr:hypothetical protein K0M31_019830 [Melipona bicolor]